MAAALFRMFVAVAAAAAGMALAQPAWPVADGGDPPWSTLSAQQRAALAPLEREWSAMEPARKHKWLEVAERFPSLSPDERARAQERMAVWSRLTPQQRNQARLQFQEARRLPPEERQHRWEAYQALPPERREEFARRAAPRSRAGDAPRADAATKSNVVPNPSDAAAVRPVAPNVVQARPGASTTWGVKPAAPPPHQQTGMPKIAATPGFVDSATLLPQRGPQGAAVRPVPGSEPRRQK